MGKKKQKEGAVTKYANLVASLLGIMISSYSLFVELKKESDPSYIPACDWHEYVSCTKAFMSEYGKGFGLVGPLLGEDSFWNQFNSLYGIILYGVAAILGFMGTKTTLTAQKWLAVAFNLGSAYLWYILTFKLQNVCIVCYATYVVNGILLVTVLGRLRPFKSAKKADKRS